MERDAGYSLFLGFGILWITLGIGAIVLFMRSENIPLRFDKWALVVVLPIVIPLIAALVIAALRT